MTNGHALQQLGLRRIAFVTNLQLKYAVIGEELLKSPCCDNITHTRYTTKERQQSHENFAEIPYLRRFSIQIKLTYTLLQAVRLKPGRSLRVPHYISH